MRPVPNSYNLFWSSNLPGESGAGMMELVPRRPGILLAVAPLGAELRITRPPPIEAIVLFPSLFTPALCEEGGALELLLLAPSDPPFNAELVNRHLKVAPGLDAGRWATQKPLAADARSAIEVEKTQPENGILATHGAFRGILDERFFDVLKAWQDQRAKVRGTAGRPKLDTLYRVRIQVSCLAAAVGPASSTVKPEAPPPGVWRGEDPHDELARSVLLRKNGKGLGGQEGPGTPAVDGKGLHAFPVNEARATCKLDLSQPDKHRPVRAHHPVFVYPKGMLGHASFGHVSDLHVNSRQQVLARSPARVVDVDEGEDVAGASPEIGELVNVYADNVLSVMQSLAHAGADVLLVGGDIIDHVKNVYPFTEHHTPAEQELLKPGAEKKPSARAVWELVGLDDDGRTKKNYQPFVDHLGVYSMVCHFYANYNRPVFGVTGNHDAYLEPYGISPRLLWGSYKANPGIPADHNLTFYEATLAFGKSYGEVSPVAALWLHKHLFEWFHGVFTPFRDYTVDLPEQRLVGLAWGDDEAKIDLPPVGHGPGHLPRANCTLGSPQWSLVQQALQGEKKKVLSTHFTFVSYDDSIPNADRGTDPAANPARDGTVLVTGRYTDNDLGTFEKLRPQVYDKVAGGAFRLIFTGHSHRKGLYRLKGKTFNIRGGGYGADMYSIDQPLDAKSAPLREIGSQTAVVVSDCAGPLPRQNHRDEFATWGSDRPSGTLVHFTPQGEIASVQAVRAGGGRPAPRLAVAIDYLHVKEGHGVEGIRTSEWGWWEDFDAKNHFLRIEFHKKFPRQSVRLVSVDLHLLPAQGKAWTRLSLGGAKESKDGPLVVTLGVPSSDNPTFGAWLKAQKVPRFLSLHFKPRDEKGFVASHYDWVKGGAWHVAAECKIQGLTKLFHYEVELAADEPDYDARARYFPKKYG